MVLAAPLMVSALSFVVMKVTNTALVGHTGTENLAAVALSDLWTSSTGVFIQGRVLGVFVGNAVGAGDTKLAGIWLQVERLDFAATRKNRPAETPHAPWL